MSNRHFIKKKPQNKSYSSPGICNNFLSPEGDSGSIEGSSIGPIYEQIKSEVVSSVLNWLSMYMAADQEDKKVNEQTHEPIHCCECTLNRRNDKVHKSPFSPTFSSLDFTNSKEFGNGKSKDIGTSTTDDDFQRVINPVDTPEDVNMVITEFKAGQVWPDWCKYLEKASDKHSNSNLSNSPVYYDKFNDRLCVYRRGLVEYPQLRKQSPRIESANLAFKQNLKSIPEIRESLNKNYFDLLNETKKVVIPCENSKESKEYLQSPESRNVSHLKNLNLIDDCNSVNYHQMTDYLPNDNVYSNMVKWISLPNVQFPH